MKPKLYIHVREATHFLRWERPEFEKYFELVPAPSKDAAMLVYGPEVVDEGAALPAKMRYAYIFPGFSCNPLHNLPFRQREIAIFRDHYDLVFFNNGPLAKAYAALENSRIVPYSVNTNLIDVRQYRTAINSLLHVSGDAPQKDWQRSVAIMQATGLPHLVFPPRGSEVHTPEQVRKRRINRLFAKLGVNFRYDVPPKGYADHERVIELYHGYDAFVHVAGEVFHPLYVDGHILTTSLEAGLTGAILFWHDTHGVGKALETTFDLPLDVDKAAAQIMEIRSGIDVEKHSKATRDEILEKYDPARSVKIRAERMLERIS